MKSVQIGKSVRIFDHCSIGLCTIEDGVQIHSGSIVEDGVTIGRNATIGAGCILGRDAFVGDQVILHEGVIVCANARVEPSTEVQAGSVIRA